MNNGRDCLHGRQVGKCDTCDLIVAELELQKVTAEREALAAQLVMIRKIFRDESLSTSETLRKIPFIIDLTPNQCLAELRAEAGRSGFVSGYEFCLSTLPPPYSCLIAVNYKGMAERYADSVRQEGK